MTFGGCFFHKDNSIDIQLIFCLHKTDIAHVCRKFVGPLPSNLEEYVTIVQKNFPYIVDTKILLNANNILQLKMKKSSTSLFKAFAILCPHIASGVSNSGLANSSSIAVEVQVDDMRYAFPVVFAYYGSANYNWLFNLFFSSLFCDFIYGMLFL